MKITGLLLLIFFQTKSANALELYLKTDSNRTKKFIISKLEGIQVNAECLKDKKHCLELLSKPKNPNEKKESDGSIGNPASDFCLVKNGASAILEDKKHNEYDYCVFENKFYVDSWDFYKKYRK